MMGFKY